MADDHLEIARWGTILGEDNERMSKSRGNVVNPDIGREYGADTLRLYEMFMGDAQPRTVRRRRCSWYQRIGRW